jgi:hypothetical protein
VDYNNNQATHNSFFVCVALFCLQHQAINCPAAAVRHIAQ